MRNMSSIKYKSKIEEEPAHKMREVKVHFGRMVGKGIQAQVLLYEYTKLANYQLFIINN